MTATALLLVIGSGMIHSIWNLYAKKSINKSVFLWFCQLVAIVIFLPWTLVDVIRQPLTPDSYFYLGLSAFLHGTYIVLLSKAYTIGDLSQVYPIMRGTSPLLVPLIAVSLLGEQLPLQGWLGILLIVVGIYTISDFSLRRSGSYRAPLLALAVGVTIALYIVVDKIALTHVSPVVLNQASNIGNAAALSWAVFRSGSIIQEWRVNRGTIVLGGLLAPGGYLLFLFALSLAPVAQLAPMREIGTVFGTLLGIAVLKESRGTKRVISSILITIGVIVLGASG